MWDVEHEKIQKVEQKAALIKDKMVPMVVKELQPQLGEFEEAKHLIEKDGEIYAEVFDLLEEFIKTHRAKKKA